MKNILSVLFLILFSLITRKTVALQLSSESDLTNPVIPITVLDMQRVEQIAKLLTEKPAGFGNPCSDRVSWNALMSSGKYQKVIEEASAMLNIEFPEFDMEAYMGMFTKGDSQSGKDILTSRLEWMVTLCWAECLEDNGQYIPKLELVIDELIKQKTWVNPRNYTEESYGGLVELSTASYAHNMAQALYLLGNKLSPTTRKNMLDALYKRAFNPILATIAGNDRNHNWLVSTNNWNAVCLSGVTGAALATITDKTERAKFVAIAERYVQNFMAGFHNDGYCSEGIGYYNYGFGRFITLREHIFHSTNGIIDFFDNPKIKKIAGFLPNMQIVNGTYPSIADCRINTKPGPSIMYYTSRNLGMGLSEYDTISLLGTTSDLIADVMYVFPNTASKTAAIKARNSNYVGIRSYFNEAGILTLRPLSGTKGHLGAVLKGGKNNEHHNHNDLGSYTIAVGDEILMGDPGLIPYTAKTFGPQRYEYKTLASYGHPVPLVAGQQQRAGKEAVAKIIRAKFNENQDLFDMDITSAYEPGILKSLVRKFDYQRINNISLKVSDVFQFKEAQIFETAIITRSSWKHHTDGQIVLQGKRGKLLANIQVPEGGYSLHAEEIMEENGVPYTRLAIRLNQPLSTGTVTITYKEE